MNKYISSYGTDCHSQVSIIGYQNVNFLFAFDTCGKLTKIKEVILKYFLFLHCASRPVMTFQVSHFL